MGSLLHLLKNWLRGIGTLILEAWKEFTRDKASRLAAGLSFYTAFSIAPLLVIAIAIAGFVFGEEAARGEVAAQLDALLGSQGAQYVETMVEEADRPGAGVLATLIGIVTLGWGAMRVFVALQDTLNMIWRVEPLPERPWWQTLRHHLLSFSMVVVIGFLLLVSLLVNAALAAVSAFLANHVPIDPSFWWALNSLVSLGIITVLFALVFKVLPDTEIAWREVWIGALVTALLFTVGQFLIGAYLGQSAVVSVFGAAGSLAVFLVWVYYMAQLVFFG
ncbi:MAG: YihY/virulence factor BrkB family protein, partial [Bradymonadaceae bacterium]